MTAWWKFCERGITAGAPKRLTDGGAARGVAGRSAYPTDGFAASSCLQTQASAGTRGKRREPFPNALGGQGKRGRIDPEPALAALLFLYEHVVEKPLHRIEGVVRARKPKRLPVVLTRAEPWGSWRVQP